MGPKMAETPREPEVAYRDDSFDGDDSPLLAGARDDPKLVAKVTFSFVNNTRLVSIPINIALLAFIFRSSGTGSTPAVVIFGFIACLLLLWNIYKALDHWACFGQTGDGSVQCELLGIVFMLKRSKSSSFIDSRAKHYVTNLVDLGFSLFMALIAILAFRTRIWEWSRYYYTTASNTRVGGLCCALAPLQFMIAVLGLLSVFRKAKFCIYRVEENERSRMGRVQLPQMSDPERGHISISASETPAVREI